MGEKISGYATVYLYNNRTGCRLLWFICCLLYYPKALRIVRFLHASTPSRKTSEHTQFFQGPNSIISIVNLWSTSLHWWWKAKVKGDTLDLLHTRCALSSSTIECLKFNHIKWTIMVKSLIFRIEYCAQWLVRTDWSVKCIAWNLFWYIGQKCSFVDI